jgi:hypothetical protein
MGFLALLFPTMPVHVVFLAHCFQLELSSSLMGMMPQPPIHPLAPFIALLLALGPVVLNPWPVLRVVALSLLTHRTMSFPCLPQDAWPPMMGFVPPPLAC